ncbi:hypothetical protein SAMN05444722_0330 [Rhodovulum sp. ES.010]|uniref:DUF1289 domain-containing protein n=1 Tax=Rhodovulum sp. ES.010 TaxID=1882821 RepID=UPI000925A530|nr:DUF1289 domain-containing protein [Rhodovulum sp. ES.010]SIO07644.1 hypothetical protein SAMN05444722_0330 [Rhodovulum sp. ES.010]
MSEDRPARPTGAIETPCNKVCKVDPESRLCIGCLRSMDEIGAWSRMRPEDRRRVMDELPARRPRLARS